MFELHEKFQVSFSKCLEVFPLWPFYWNRVYSLVLGVKVIRFYQLQLFYAFSSSIDASWTVFMHWNPLRLVLINLQFFSQNLWKCKNASFCLNQVSESNATYTKGKLWTIFTILAETTDLNDYYELLSQILLWIYHIFKWWSNLGNGTNWDN